VPTGWCGPFLETIPTGIGTSSTGGIPAGAGRVSGSSLSAGPRTGGTCSTSARKSTILRLRKDSPALAEGQRLAFSLRANTVVKKWHDDGKQRAHDVVMNAKWEMRQNGTWEDCDLTHAQLVQQEGKKWLAKRTGQYGFELPERQVQAEGHQKHSFEKPDGGHQVTFVTMDLTGRLRVADPETFRESLLQGIGPTKAYGCGLMLVRPT